MAFFATSRFVRHKASHQHASYPGRRHQGPKPRVHGLFCRVTVFAIIGVKIKQELGLNETQFGLLVGTPILSGSLIRIFLGIWTDQYGGRRIYTVVMLAAAVATFGLTYAHTFPQILIAALFVGIAGGSFAVGIAYVSRWFPAEKQGTALGIFGAGNVGAAVTKFCAPFVLVAYGWQTTAQVWAVGIAIMGVLFWIFRNTF